MTIKNIAKEGSKATVEVEISKQSMESAKDKVYAKAKKDIQIPGFRKGHAPRKMVETMYGADVFTEDAINEFFPEIYDGLVNEGLKLVGKPQITVMGKAEDGGIALTLETPLYPEVTVGEYKGLHVWKNEAVVTEEDIDAEINRKAMNVSRMETVEREARMGDTVNIDYEGFVDGTAFVGGKAEGQDLKLGSGDFIPGFEEQIVGMSAGTEGDINVTFPEKYKLDLAGKDAVFHIKVNAVKELIMPELDDEFVKDVSEFETMEEYRESIRKNKLEERQKDDELNYRNGVIDAACENLTADIPECMIDEEIDYQLRNIEYQLQMSGMSMEQYNQMFGGVEQVRASMRPTAERQVKTQLLLTKVIELENITASAEEMEEEYQKLAAAYQMDMDAVKQSVPEEGMQMEICHRKAADLLVESAIPVTEADEPAAEEAVEVPAAEEPAAE